jgi:hypothetical protein
VSSAARGSHYRAATLEVEGLPQKQRVGLNHVETYASHGSMVYAGRGTLRVTSVPGRGCVLGSSSPYWSGMVVAEMVSRNLRGRGGRHRLNWCRTT